MKRQPSMNQKVGCAVYQNLDLKFPNLKDLRKDFSCVRVISVYGIFSSIPNGLSNLGENTGGLDEGSHRGMLIHFRNIK